VVSGRGGRRGPGEGAVRRRRSGGRLPATFPDSEAQLPTSGDPTKYPGAADVYYKEGIFVGYRWYDAHDLTPAFPFGFGLSYTTFRYANLRLTPTAASFDITNTGRRAGTDVPQLYVGDPASTGEPPRQLKGYEKVSLRPGQTTRSACRSTRPPSPTGTRPAAPGRSRPAATG